MEKSITLSRDNKNIIGMMHYPKDTSIPSPVVIMSHGFSGDKIGPYPYLFVLTARILADHGFCVLRFDFTGSGDSEGAFEDQTLLTQVADLKTVVDHVLTDPIVDTQNIFLLGHSRGGAVSIMVASDDNRIKGLVTWATPATWDDIWRDCEETFNTQGFIELSTLRETKDLYTIDLQNQPKDYGQKVTQPWLIVHGKQDGHDLGSVLPSHAELFHKQNPNARSLHIIESANHYFFPRTDREELWQTTIQWLKNHASS